MASPPPLPPTGSPMASLRLVGDTSLSTTGTKPATDNAAPNEMVERHVAKRYWWAEQGSNLRPRPCKWESGRIRTSVQVSSRLHDGEHLRRGIG